MEELLLIVCAMLGAVSILFWFLVLFFLSLWNPSTHLAMVIAFSIAALNLASIVWLLYKCKTKRRYCLVSVGILCNGLSLCMFAYGLTGLVYLNYFFHI